ncbi:MAG: hypothetical protein ACFCUI_03825 [Bernardetiaceae bacterium]
MKTFCLFFVFLFFLVQATFSQRLSLGARMGPARAFLVGASADPNGSYRWAYQGGLFADIALSDNWHLQNDFQWARKGYQNDTTRLSMDYAVWSPTLSYLFSGFEGEALRGRLLGGLYAGQLLDWRRSVADYREVFYDQDYGFVWGGGLTWHWMAYRQSHYFHLDLRGHIGLRRIYPQGAQVRLIVWQLTLGYALPVIR